MYIQTIFFIKMEKKKGQLCYVPAFLCDMLSISDFNFQEAHILQLFKIMLKLQGHTW